MPTGWFWSLHCKSNAIADVISCKPTSTTDVIPSKPTSIADVIPSKPNSITSSSLSSLSSLFSKPSINPPKPSTQNPKPSTQNPKPSIPSISPSLTSLPSTHSSRRIIELIFLSSWAKTGDDPPFPGQICTIFKIRNPLRVVTQFEQYRVKIRNETARSDPRCAADGNEMMRFLNGLTDFNWCKRIRTFAGSGDAHRSAERASGLSDLDGSKRTEKHKNAGLVNGLSELNGSKRMRSFKTVEKHKSEGWVNGLSDLDESKRMVNFFDGLTGLKRTMLVCRVIAGRVGEGEETGEEFGSVKKGEEILVLDRRAVLPCFLIVYKI